MATIDTGITPELLKSELADIRTCRQAIYLTGSSVNRLGLSLTRANPEALQAREDTIIRQLIKMSDEGPVNVFDFSNSTGVGGTQEQDWNSSL